MEVSFYEKIIKNLADSNCCSDAFYRMSKSSERQRGGDESTNEKKGTISGGTLKGKTWLYDDSSSGTSKPEEKPAESNEGGSGENSSEGGSGSSSGSESGSSSNTETTPESESGSSGSAYTTVNKLYIHFDDTENIAWFGSVSWQESAGQLTGDITYTPKYRGPYTADTKDGSISFAFDLQQVTINDSQSTSNNNSSFSSSTYWKPVDYEDGAFDPYAPYNPYEPATPYEPYNPGNENTEPTQEGTDPSNTGSEPAAQTQTPISTTIFWGKDALTQSSIRKSLNGGEESYGLFDNNYKTSKMWDDFGYTASDKKLYFQAEYKDAGYDAWTKWTWEKPTVTLDDAKLEGSSVDTKDLKGKIYIKDKKENESNYSYIVFGNTYGYIAIGTDGIKIDESGNSYKDNFRGSAKASSIYVVSNGYVIVDGKQKFKISDDEKTLADDYKLTETKIYGSTEKFPSLKIGTLSDTTDYLADKDWCFQEASYISDDGKTELRFVNDSEVYYYRYFTSNNTYGSVCSRILPDGFYNGSTFIPVTSDSSDKSITIYGTKLKFKIRPTYSLKADTADNLKITELVLPAVWQENSRKYNKNVFQEMSAKIDENAKTITLDALTADDYKEVFFNYKLGTDESELYVNDALVKNAYNNYKDKYDYSIWYIGHDSNGNLYWFDENNEYKQNFERSSVTWSNFTAIANDDYVQIAPDEYYPKKGGQNLYMPDGSQMTYKQYKAYLASALEVETPEKAKHSNEAYYSARMVIGETDTSDSYFNGYDLIDGTKLTVKKGDLSKTYTVKIGILTKYTITFVQPTSESYFAAYTGQGLFYNYYPYTSNTVYTYTKEYGLKTKINDPIANYIKDSTLRNFYDWNTAEDGSGTWFKDFETPFEAGAHTEDISFYPIWKSQVPSSN